MRKIVAIRPNHMVNAILAIGALGSSMLIGCAGQIHGERSMAATGTPVVSETAGDKSQKSRELTGKVAIITGAARNLGRGCAEALARNGADIVIHYHTAGSKADAEETARLVRSNGVRAILVSGDLSKVNNIKRMFDETFKAFGRVDIVVNNAGKIVKKPVAQITEDDYDSVFGINSKGSFFVMQEAARRIADNGRIINIGSSLVGATTGLYSVYAGSKASMEHFTRALAKEIGGRGVTVNMVAPGAFDTPFFRGPETPETIAYISRGSVAGRLGKVDDMVPLIEFLALPRSQWITAQTIFINGGYLAR